MNDQRLYQIGLTMIDGIGAGLAQKLLDEFGEPELIFYAKPSQLEKIYGINKKLSSNITNPEVLKNAEKELTFIDKNRISCYFIKDDNYPQRLKESKEAPILFYMKGCANLHLPRIVSIVGTRKITDYGREITEKFISGLQAKFPDVLIVSGLAYGVDICAHRSALRNKLSTVAVLAHGLDRIYPATHRETAIEMLNTGGLITEFPSGITPERMNFVMRNRIIAWLSDATVVIESGKVGGSLITADLAFSEGRSVFAFPGKATDENSQGCNRIIRNNKAGLISNVDDFIYDMIWESSAVKPEKHIQQELPFAEDDEMGIVLKAIREKGEINVDELSIELDIPVYRLNAISIELDMMEHIKIKPGSIFKAI